MKILTVNFLNCAVKTCKSSPLSYPLHFRECELEQAEMEFNPTFLRNIMPRIEWDALRTSAGELGFSSLPIDKPEFTAAAASVGGADLPREGGTGNEGGRSNEGGSGEEDGRDDQGGKDENGRKYEEKQREDNVDGAEQMDLDATAALKHDKDTKSPNQQHQQQLAPALETEKIWRDLHKLLLETQVVEGKMVCGNCGHEYKIKDGIANFLLPNHLV